MDEIDPRRISGFDFGEFGFIALDPDIHCLAPVQDQGQHGGSGLGRFQFNFIFPAGLHGVRQGIADDQLHGFCFHVFFFGSLFRFLFSFLFGFFPGVSLFHRYDFFRRLFRRDDFFHSSFVCRSVFTHRSRLLRRGCFFRRYAFFGGSGFLGGSVFIRRSSFFRRSGIFRRTGFRGRSGLIRRRNFHGGSIFRSRRRFHDGSRRFHRGRILSRRRFFRGFLCGRLFGNHDFFRRRNLLRGFLAVFRESCGQQGEQHRQCAQCRENFDQQILHETYPFSCSRFSVSPGVTRKRFVILQYNCICNHEQVQSHGGYFAVNKSHFYPLYRQKYHPRVFIPRVTLDLSIRMAFYTFS